MRKGYFEKSKKVKSMNKFLNGLTDATNFTLTENGAITHKTTRSDLLDLFAMGGAYRTRSDEDVILLFKNAYTHSTSALIAPTVSRIAST